MEPQKTIDILGRLEHAACTRSKSQHYASNHPTARKHAEDAEALRAAIEAVKSVALTQRPA